MTFFLSRTGGGVVVSGLTTPPTLHPAAPPERGRGA